jgi:hypothetical protein
MPKIKTILAGMLSHTRCIRGAAVTRNDDVRRPEGPPINPRDGPSQGFAGGFVDFLLGRAARHPQ